MTNIEQAIADIVAAQVAQAEKRILEQLSSVSSNTLSFSEACQYLHMSAYTLRRLCKEKRIPHRIHGAEGSKNPRYLFDSSSLDRWKKDEEQRNYQP
ncbi:helix-turn-helix domain-containing protein [Paenibacillus maysiensis]|uniref:helix-turn-helix domain-containing protein n=1 Tax=Paenibacillus maysiensis TaxID=1155954 RepID=UPI00046EFB41|nr:helix-turn-helix domain-containing protein [Paenibacillus maysiensis]